MRSAMRVAGLWGMALVSVALLAGRASANPKEVEPGVLVEDFEDGKLDQYWMKTFGNRVPPEAEIVKREGKAVLKLGGEIGWMQLGLKDRKFKDFVFEARIRKAFFRAGYAGLQFRGNYRVYFRQRGFVNLRDPHNRSLGESLTGHNIEEYKDFKVVCAGPVIRVYVDGELVLDSYDLEPVEGGLALITHSKHGFIDDYKIDTNVPGEHYIMVQPRAPDECLVFPPGKKLVLGFTAANLSESEKRIGVAATLKTWDGKALTETLRHQVRLAAGKRHEIDLDALERHRENGLYGDHVRGEEHERAAVAARGAGARSRRVRAARDPHRRLLEVSGELHEADLPEHLHARGRAESDRPRHQHRGRGRRLHQGAGGRASAIRRRRDHP